MLGISRAPLEICVRVRVRGVNVRDKIIIRVRPLGTINQDGLQRV